MVCLCWWIVQYFVMFSVYNKEATIAEPCEWCKYYLIFILPRMMVGSVPHMLTPAHLS